MTNLIDSINTLCAELRSDKVNTRNKAAEQLNTHLSSSKIELLSQLNKRSEDNVSWTTIFNSSIDSTIKHAIELNEIGDSKQFQKMRNKNFIYGTIINKLINYNMEDSDHLFSKTTLFNGFVQGFQCRAAMQHFSELFLSILNLGIFKSSQYLRELKPNEYSIILSYLFETNKGGDDVFRFASLKAIIRTIELAQDYVLISEDIMDYFPDVINFAKKANDDIRKADIIKLYYLLISQYSVDYHNTICCALQDILPEIIGFYQYNMRVATKDLLFKALFASLKIIYPFIHLGNVNTINVHLNDSWPKTVRKLKTMMDAEITEQKSVYYQNNRNQNNSSNESFVKMAALVVFLVYWHTDEDRSDESEETNEPPLKISKSTDKLEMILNNLQSKEEKFSEIWLSILAELVTEIEAVVDVCNHQQLLLTMLKILQDYGHAKNLKNIRLCLKVLLRKQDYFSKIKSLPKDYCQQTWLQIVQFLGTDTSSDNKVIAEKQQIIQDLITYQKVTADQSSALISSFLASSIYRRADCVSTVQHILAHANHLGLDKTSEVIASFLQWMYNENDKNDAKNILMHVTPLRPELIANTCALAVINFLNSNHFNDNEVMPRNDYILELLLFKYNRKFVCLERHGKSIKALPKHQNISLPPEQKNCLFQSNYELLMRTVNFQMPKGINTQDILAGLNSLLKIVLLMKYLVLYDTIDESTFEQCPLIKRIGIFLSHLELQFKSNKVKDLERSNLIDILNLLKHVVEVFTCNSMLLQYLEMQPLEEIIEFISLTVKYAAKQLQTKDEYNETRDDDKDWLIILDTSLYILAILCASTTHMNDSLKSIASHNFNLSKQTVTIVELIKIFCQQQHSHEEIANWFVGKLKTIFQLFYTNIELIEKIVLQIPAIFAYVQSYDDHIDDMLMAVYSLLKISLRKAYPHRLIMKIIDSVRLVAHVCNNIFMKENFKNICLSVVKFLTINSLDIQFVTVNTITALIDENWHHDISVSMEIFYKFCDDLYKTIEWKKLRTESSYRDQKQNNITINIQMLLSFVTFSRFHRDEAFKELTYVCAFFKVTEVDLKDFHQLGEFHHCNPQHFVKHCMTSAIHNWIQKSYPILKFPFYLGYENEREFLKTNIEEIVCYLLLYNNLSDLQKLHKYGTMDKLITIASPLLRAFVLYNQCLDDGENPQMHKNVENIVKLNISVPDELVWKTICQLLKLLQDDGHAKSITNFSIFFQTSEWYNINYDTLQLLLSNNGGAFAKQKQMKRNLQHLLKADPLTLVKALNVLKSDCSDHPFPMGKLQSFYRFVVLADFITGEFQNTTTIPKGCIVYFTRDIIFYILNILNQEIPLNFKLFALISLDTNLTKLFDINAAHKILQENCDGLCRVLFKICEKSDSLEIQQQIVNILQNFIKRCDIFTMQHYRVLQEMPSTECLEKIHKIRNEKFCDETKTNWEIDLMNFNKSANCTVDQLRVVKEKIVENKKFLKSNSDLLYQLMKQLLQIVRQSQHKTTSLEALKCLGEIGPLSLPQTTYYFQINAQFQEEFASTDVSNCEFYKAVFLTLEKLSQSFQASTGTLIIDVAQYLVNSKEGAKLLKEFPHFCVFRSNISNNYLNRTSEIKPLDWLGTIKSIDYVQYDKWMCQFVGHIFGQCGWLHFEQLALTDFYFAENLFLPFIKNLININKNHMDNIITMLEDFFSEFMKHYQQHGGRYSEETTIYAEKRIINVMLQICECIRLSNNWCLPLNLLNVAQACNFCQAYFLSIMYQEMWALQNKSSSTSDCETFEIASNEQFQHIAKKAYESIGCMDAISGFLNPLTSRLDYLNLTNNWSDIFIEATNISDADTHDLYMSILKRNGMLGFADVYTNTHNIDYEICWRLCRWETVVEGHSKVDTLNDMEHEFQKHHFNALKCLNNREENNCLAAISKCLHCVLSILQGISVECLQSLYKYLTWLQLLQQTEDFCKIQFFKSNGLNEIFDKWHLEAYELEYGNFVCKEQILSHQLVLFSTAGVRASRQINEFYKNDPTEKCLLNCINASKQAGNINVAKRYISILKSKVLQDDNSNQPIKLSAVLEDADICFKSGKHAITKSLLHYALNGKEFKSCPERVRAFQLYGEYLLETNSDTFESVLTSYFQRSLDVLENVENSEERILQRFPNLFELENLQDFQQRFKRNIHETIAKYADREYTQLNTYINSDQFITKQKIMENNSKAVENDAMDRNHEKAASVKLVKRFTSLDINEIQLIEQRRTRSLCIAMEHYIKFCCLDTVLSSSVIYRIIALWFANQQSKELQILMEKNIATIPSYKFICALNQMTARLNSENAEFTKMLIDIMVRCVQEHPHHTLYKLYPFVYGHMDGNDNKKDLRSKKALEIIELAKNKSNGNILKQLETVIPALVEFANMKIDPKETNRATLSVKLSKIRNLDAIHCPTIELPLSPNSNYNIINIIKWEKQISLVGGINAPKKLLCVCSDGVTRPQLLKGKDDLRQDAVMQQVFRVINSLLEKEPEAVQRKLRLRTYKVVPLSTRSGILEWCENTIPLGAYLCPNHEKYRPNDYTTTRCRHLSRAHQNSDAQKRLEVFEHICQNIKPVFQYFFFEKFHKPGDWFEKRLAYTNSVATTSIVGFILGLGDRHTQNILIDYKSAEVIHIDFGIAFEQGKVMPTPETVPFRLTRDIVAPMGINGPNGVFKKSCEITMAMLRHHQDLITTILEVLLYDPLYMWKLLPQLNNHDPKEKNTLAQRALIVVQSKLDGKVSGVFGTASVTAQVERLINEAVLPKNLCMLFSGWDPYL